MLFPPCTNIDAGVAQEIRRPQTALAKYSSSKNNVVVLVKNPNSDISRFSEKNPLVKKFKTKLINIMYEAQSQRYVLPDIDCLNAALKSFGIIHKHRLGIHSYTPLAEGGIALDTYYGNKYIHIQFDNEGDGACI